ncbi:MAG: hypothetical protein J2P31_16370 [Blastocatellia bacterium]|nr:hypothetical protein [Blastocatellia bacterium]
MRWVKTFHGILWVTPLALSVYVEDSAFSFLEGIKVPHAAVSLVGYTVSLSLSVLIISPGMELLMRSNARSIARAVVAIDRAEIRYYKRRKMRRARKDLRDLERLRKRTVEMSARLTLKALEVGSDIQLSANEVRRQQGVLDNWRHEMYETRREITEYEQKIRDFLATTNKSGKSLEDSLNAEYLSRIEAAIMRMDYELPQPEPRKSDETGS